MQTINSLLNQLTVVASAVTKSDMAAIFLADSQEVVISAVGGSAPGVESLVGTRVPLGSDNPWTHFGLSRRESIIENSSLLPPYVQALIERYGMRGVVGVPISGDRGVDGVLLLATRRRGFSRSVEQPARAFADLIAASLEQVHALSELGHEISDLNWLANITDKIRLEEGRDKVIQAVLEAGMEVLSADAMALYLLDEDEKLICECAKGLPISLVAPKQDEQQAALLDVINQADPLVISDIQMLSVEDPFRELVLDVSIRGILGLQLRHRGRAIGLLTALYRRPSASSERRTELCRYLALNTAVALNYSRLLDQSRLLVNGLEEANERLAQQAIHDGLTNLANHRAFQQRVTEHVHRVGRYNEKFSLVMIDVDHFKSYNDSYGHQEGDLALKHIARIIAEQVRESDFAARYGGEEFAVILPHTTKSQSKVAVERIRAAIDEFEFPNGKLTISAGIAECPADGVAPSEVLEKADRALYHAKLTGRNRICLWASAPEEGRNGVDSGSDNKTSVLVVENDLDARLLVENALRLAGYELHRASSTQEAISLLRTQKFDIMLSDAIILDAEGMQILGLASAIHPTMPIVVTTAASMAGVAKLAMRHGVTDLLVKPFNENELPVIIERNLERKRLERQMLLEKSTGILLQAIDALVAAIDAKDRLTAGHSARVTHVSLAIADTMGLPSEDRYTLELAARLHDIGKISLPDSALNKAGKLSDEEWAAMRRHPSVGSQIVGAIEELSYIATIVRHHHERLDGSGYPDGLQGEAIPLLSRIIAVADGFEAMTSERSFRGKMSPNEAVEELRRCVGTTYSCDIVEALMESLETGAIDTAKLLDAA